MSSTRKGPKVLEHCAYFTTPKLARALVDVLDIPRDAKILEPHGGAGAFIRALHLTGHRGHVSACEIDAARVRHLKLEYGIEVCHTDFLDFTLGGWDLICGNPPFSRPALDGRLGKGGKVVLEPAAELHTRHALSLLAPGG